MLKKFHIVIALVILFITNSVKAQNNIEIADKKALDADELINRGHLGEAISLLKEAEILNPSNTDYPYKIAYAYYMIEEYDSALKILNKIAYLESSHDGVFQLLGNCYKMMGRDSDAVDIYKKGLEFFPNSGLLYLELGNHKMKLGLVNEALGYYEKGVETDPAFASNYYWASKIYCSSTEKVWGILYGEIFINLEQNSTRKDEISKLIFDTYKSQITFSENSNVSINFTQNSELLSEDLEDTSTHAISFSQFVFEPLTRFSLLNETSVSLSSLNRIRTQYLNLYFKASYNQKYPNILYNYQKNLVDSGYFEAYNYWLFMNGNEKEFLDWQTENAVIWNNFQNWFNANSLIVDSNNHFYRRQY
ncbi:hypothetical protein SDC9_46025 [bioreactor metagenome]|uniref:Tetratricopeptide repeat protein n=1 Tax=bioreactor metagenome TaxID=1076179 RepID=A0A644W7K0_9ZZZZ